MEGNNGDNRVKAITKGNYSDNRGKAIKEIFWIPLIGWQGGRIRMRMGEKNLKITEGTLLRG